MARYIVIIAALMALTGKSPDEALPNTKTKRGNIMTTATAIFYGSLTGYIARLNDGSYRKIYELNRLGGRVSKKLVETLLDNPITVSWRGKPFISKCPETMAKVILGTINSGLAGNSGVS